LQDNLSRYEASHGPIIAADPPKPDVPLN
jgi:hypothetical protein